MQLSKTQFFLIAGGAIVVGAVILIFTGVIPGLRTGSGALTGDLVVWGVFDDISAVQGTLIKDFTAVNPGVRITYRQMDPRTYEQELINALAAGTGPDVFYFKNSWLPKHGNKLAPLDARALPVQQVRELFPDVVVNDLTSNGQVYALPLYLDTLALYYNKTLLDNASIAQPPRSWNELVAMIPKLRRFDQSGRITRAAIALGSSARTINEATDILSLIMLQRGTEMVNSQFTRAVFASEGLAPVTFYTDFANARSSSYTWDPTMHYSIDAFAEEGAAMMLNYAYQIPEIRAKNPFLNFAVAPMLQIAPDDKQVNYANYFALAVAAGSHDPALAWAFVTFATIDPAANGAYLNAVSRPPALRSLIMPNINDPEIGLFVRQALTATSWPQADASGVDASFTKMLDLINTGQLPIDRALRQAEGEVTELIQKVTGN